MEGAMLTEGFYGNVLGTVVPSTEKEMIEVMEAEEIHDPFIPRALFIEEIVTRRVVCSNGLIIESQSASVMFM